MSNLETQQHLPFDLKTVRRQPTSKVNLIPFHRSQRGSLLLVTMIFGVIIATAIGGYLNLGRTAMHLANRTFYAHGSINLGEAGIEEALLALNTEGFDWTGWTIDSGNASRTFTGFKMGPGAGGSVKVQIINYLDDTSPTVVVEGISELADGTTVSKQIEVNLYRRSMFANGMVARDRIVFNGNRATVDSYNSNNGEYDVATNRNDRGSIASLSVSVDAINVQNADIWGYVATGGAMPEVGPNGSIMGEDTPAGTTVDTERIATDFSASLDPVEVPDMTGATNLATLNTTTTLGVIGTSTKYTATGISLASSNVLTITGTVTLEVTGDIRLAGNAEIVISPGATLIVYLQGDASFAGQGVSNLNTAPLNFQLYGTSTSPTGQDISFSGNADVKGVTYAPNASISIVGNGDTYGAFVGNDITVGGLGAFHYDESLADFGADNPFALSQWRELYAAEDRYAFGF